MDTTVIAVIRFLRYLVLYPLLFLFTLASCKITERSFLRIMRILFLSAGVVFIIAWLDALTEFGNTYTTNMLVQGGLPFTKTRAISTLGSPNNLGSYAGLVMVAIAILNAEGVLQGVVSRRFALILFVGAIGSLFFSFSRGALFAFLVTLPWILYLYRKRGYSGHGFLIVALMGILMLLVFLVINEARGPSVSFNSRIDKISYNIELMAEVPWSYFIGLGIARGYTSGESLLSLEGLDFTRADNFFLMIFVEGGLIGLGLFLNLLVSIVKKLKTSHGIVRSSIQRTGCSLAIGMLLYLIGWGFTSVSFRLFPAAYLTWMFIGVALSLIRHEQKSMR